MPKIEITLLLIKLAMFYFHKRKYVALLNVSVGKYEDHKSQNEDFLCTNYYNGSNINLFRVQSRAKSTFGGGKRAILGSFNF